eukprot:TRINITY_DN2218_c0_g1_i1.p1 TRINITY_DN2218_c0_g1~~TRINITY_DN2218_c0_g1_i1.p1  ORF type:complete len:1419 (+),score=297.20 TRINITY_DN2218_c0_g1_i1:362-4618(+)
MGLHSGRMKSSSGQGPALRPQQKSDDKIKSTVSRESDVPLKIDHIQFGMLSGTEMRNLSEIRVFNSNPYHPDTKMPVEYGPLDPRLGVSGKDGKKCTTCGKLFAECAGHWGFVELYFPVFHVGFLSKIQNILQMVCKKCSNVLLSPKKKLHYLNVLQGNLGYAERKALARHILDVCQKKRKKKPCRMCDSWNGTVTKVKASFLFLHVPWESSAGMEEKEMFKDSFREASSEIKELPGYLEKAGEIINPIRCKTIFERISHQDLLLLDMDPNVTRPEHMVLTHLLAPPCCIRPSVTTGFTSNEDDLTIKLKEIVSADSSLRGEASKGTPLSALYDKWDHLQFECAKFINSSYSGFPKEMKSKDKKPTRGIVQRLKGKGGRFRCNLSGKRVDFTGRTVISPDPNLGIHQVGVPELVATTLTFPEKVTSTNIERMRTLVLRGPDVHPGAKLIVDKEGTRSMMLKYGDRVARARELKIGDTVERHLDDGDIVLFNRQPSLHRISIMSHRAKILPHRTFRFNECVCAPYNADFDGDEMNLHVPQTQEARAEALFLMSSVENLVTPRDGSILIAATQDFLTTSFMLTSRDIFYDRAQFAQIASYYSSGDIRFEFPEPALLKPVELFTGKQVFSVLINHSSKDRINVNLTRKTKNYVGDVDAKEFDKPEGYVVIRNGDLLCGVPDKSILGGGKNTFFQLLLRDYGNVICSDRMTKLAKLSARWIGNHGFSIGIEDVTPSEKLKAGKKVLIEEAYQKCDDLLEQFRIGKLVPHPGSSLEQTLEAEIGGILSKVRDDVGTLCTRELPPHNSPLIMSQCGSKGSKVNISQMVASVGQQIVTGKRIPNGFYKRTLPHFKQEDARSPVAKGFVSNSFFSGLEPPEFFFHTMGGREGLIDTAVKTAETGYMQRRLMKALEDLSVQYDGSVRTSTGWLVQFIYGDDGIEPTYVEDEKGPVDYERIMTNVLNSNIGPGKVMLKKEEAEKILTHQFSVNPDLKRLSSFYKKKIQEYCFNEKAAHYGNPRLDKQALINFLRTVGKKMMGATAEAGTSVGALAAQSIGEPCTQMTLKTFHFAGVASMNITLGVPRIKEIMDATKNIKSPIIEVFLNNPESEEEARRVKGSIERIVLGDIVDYIAEVYKPNSIAIELKINWSLARSLCVNVTVDSIIDSIVASQRTLRLGLKREQIDVGGDRRYVVGDKGQEEIEWDKIVITPTINNIKQSLMGRITDIKRRIGDVVIYGIKSVSRCVLSKDKRDASKHILYVDGQGLLDVLKIPGVDVVNTFTNHSIEAAEVLGIEAGRATIIEQVSYTMQQHAVSVDERHLKLLADMMTYRGKILGMQRTGISEMTDSILMLASFERTDDVLENAAMHSMVDKISGVSECIIMGKTVSLGTGLCDVLSFSEFPKRAKKSTLLGSNFNLSFSELLK